MTRYETLLEVELESWESGYGVLQVVAPDDHEDVQLRFCYFNDEGTFTNRPLCLSPDESVVTRTTEMIENLGYVARTFDADEVRALVETLGEERVVELAQLVDTLGEARLTEILAD